MVLMGIMVLSVQSFGSYLDVAQYIYSIQVLIHHAPVKKGSSLSQNFLFSNIGRHISGFKLFKANSDTYQDF